MGKYFFLLTSYSVQNLRNYTKHLPVIFYGWKYLVFDKILRIPVKFKYFQK